LLLAACAAQAPPESSTTADDKTIFVTSNGWHTGVVIAKSDMPRDLLPEVADFPEAAYFEFGWGDAKFYPAKDVTFTMTMAAALVPTPAVMHMVGLWTKPARYFPKAEVVPLVISPENFRRLVAFIDSSFKRPGAGRVSRSAPGLYAASAFYPAKGQFHLLNTCNTWTARALRAAGFNIDAQGTTQAEALMQQVRNLVLAPA
jgi:uncharacterized protein (TIGR02117 family)